MGKYFTWQYEIFGIMIPTGYLKCVGVQDIESGGRWELQIPNKEIHNLFEDELMSRMAAGADRGKSIRSRGLPIYGNTALPLGASTWP